MNHGGSRGRAIVPERGRRRAQIVEQKNAAQSRNRSQKAQRDQPTRMLMYFAVLAHAPRPFLHPNAFTIAGLRTAGRAARSRPILARRDAETSFRVSLAHAAFTKGGSRHRPGGNEPGNAGDIGPSPGPKEPAMIPLIHFLRDLTVMLYAITSGLTLSGITANTYRILAREPKSRGSTIVYYVVMVFAGASVLLENATRSYRKKDCSVPAYGFAVAIVGYWCFILGLGVLSAALLI
jgi:hypothetical protein